MIDNDKFLIFKPAKSSMQSGLNNTNKWCLSNCEINESYISSKFCWHGSSNPEKRVKLFFNTLEEAKKFAQKIFAQNYYSWKKKILKKSYSQNFIKKKMSNPNKFCPLWLYKIIISVTVYDYIVRDIAIFCFTKKFESFFNKYYKDLTVDEIESGATAIIQFLGEVKNKRSFFTS